MSVDLNWRFRYLLRRCFNFRETGNGETYYETLMRSWSILTRLYQGWTLSEIKELTPRERRNWMDIASAL